MTRAYCARLAEQKPNSRGLLRLKGDYLRCVVCSMMLHKDLVDEMVANDLPIFVPHKRLGNTTTTSTNPNAKPHQKP